MMAQLWELLQPGSLSGIPQGPVGLGSLTPDMEKPSWILMGAFTDGCLDTEVMLKVPEPRYAISVWPTHRLCLFVLPLGLLASQVAAPPLVHWTEREEKPREGGL